VEFPHAASLLLAFSVLDCAKGLHSLKPVESALTYEDRVLPCFNRDSPPVNPLYSAFTRPRHSKHCGMYVYTKQRGWSGSGMHSSSSLPESPFRYEEQLTGQTPINPLE